MALNADIAWNTEFGEFVLVWATFLGGAAAARRGGHMRITELVAALPRGLSRPIEVATRLAALVIIGLLVFHGVAIVERTMIDFARLVFGFVPGGLGVVTVTSSTLFGAISDSAIANSAAVGSVMIPGMGRRGYPASFSGALVATSGTLGILIPPSIPLLVFGFVGNVSIAELFMACVLPGLLFAGALMALCVYKGRALGCDVGGERPKLQDVLSGLAGTMPALLAPVIILGGIYSGFFTPTEAAAVAVLLAVTYIEAIPMTLVWAMR